MELTFTKVGKQYEAEFELTADANLHIEFESATPVKLYQRTTGGGWDLVNDVKNAVGKATDVDLQALIYPKFIKVVCPSNPSYCAVTSEGEVVEIKSQAKVVEITSNGTTSVEPDAGFSYLTGVTVKTNVPQSGGGESGEVDYKDTLEYYMIPVDQRPVPTGDFLGVLYFKLVIDDAEHGTDVSLISAYPNFYLLGDFASSQAVAVAVDPNMLYEGYVKIPSGGMDLSFKTFDEAVQQVASLGAEVPLTYKSWTRITKEEFWDLNNKHA